MSELENEKPNQDATEQPATVAPSTPVSAPPATPVQNPTEPEVEEPSFPKLKFLLETFNTEYWKKGQSAEKPNDSEENS